jgi:hypothetical protein
MKKALVILLALITVGAFAQVTAADQVPTISGNATLSWGLDIDAKTTGFANTGTWAVKLPLITKASVTKGEGDVYGFIKFTDVEWNLTSPALAGAATGAVEATLFFKPFSVSVYSAPTLSPYKNAAIVDGDAAGSVAGFTAGTTVKYDQAPITFALKVLSKGDQVANVNNDYAIGADATFVAVADVAKVNVSYAMAVGGTFAAYIGVDAPITLASIGKGLTITPAADFSIASATEMDFGSKFELKLSDKIDDKLTLLTAQVFFGQDKDLEAKVAFDEPLVDGMIKNVAAGASFQLTDILKETPMAWKLMANAGYKAIIDDKDNVVANAAFSLDQASAKSLTADVTFTNTAIANTTITVAYTSGNLLAATAVLGKVIATVKIAY